MHGVPGTTGTGIAEDPEQLRQRVARLREEHRDLDEAIARLSSDARHDQVSLQRLKKRKLALKDQVLRLEAMLVPDIIA